MHPAAYLYVNQFGTADELDVVEVGARDINGTPRSVFPNARWHGIDITAGPAVDEVADGAVWQPETPVDLVVCCEVLEHAENWRDIVANMATMVKPGGRVIITAAGPDRAPHSAVDGHPLGADEDEYYGNIDPDDLEETMAAAGLRPTVEVVGADVRAVGVLDGTAKKKRAR